MKYEVYKIQNKISNKIYIGITTQGFEKRFRKHLKEVEAGSIFILHNAIRSYGKEVFFTTLLEEVNSVKKLKEREQYWIKTLDSTNRDKGYNMTLGGDDTFGRKHSDETKKLLSLRKSVKVTATNLNTGDTEYFDSLTIAAKNLNINLNTLCSLKTKSLQTEFNNYLIIFTEPEKKLKKIKMTEPERMKMMQDKSREVRANNKEEYSQKQKDAKLSKTKKVFQLDLNGNIITEFRNKVDAAASFGKGVSAIQHCLKGRNQSAYGFKWMFEEEYNNNLLLLEA